MKALTIGKVAAQAGVSVETIRYYERQGLISKPPQRASGYREYPQNIFLLINFIRSAKQLGFTLAEIKGLRQLQSKPKATSGEVKQRFSDKLVSLAQEITRLQIASRTLNELISNCSDESLPADQCNILRTLYTKD